MNKVFQALVMLPFLPIVAVTTLVLVLHTIPRMHMKTASNREKPYIVYKSGGSKHA